MASIIISVAQFNQITLEQSEFDPVVIQEIADVAHLDGEALAFDLTQAQRNILVGFILWAEHECTDENCDCPPDGVCGKDSLPALELSSTEYRLLMEFCTDGDVEITDEQDIVTLPIGKQHFESVKYIIGNIIDSIEDEHFDNDIGLVNTLH